MAGGSIVVGVDGSEQSRNALRWAVDEARLRGASLLVVHAWWAYPDLSGTPVGPFGPEAENAAEPVERFVDDTFGGPPAGVDLTVRAVQGVTASAALLAAGETAELLVVGARGAGGFTGLLLGSVSRQVVDHATCPVVVVPAERGSL